MRKKFNFSSFLFILFILIFYNSISYSKDKCLEYFETLNSNYDKYRPDLQPLFEREGFGFSLLATWKAEEDSWDYYQDEEGYYYIGQITNHELVDKISRKQKIISMNGQDLRKLNLIHGENWFTDLFPDQDSVNLKLEGKKNILVKRMEGDIAEPYSDFYILSLDLDEKLKKIEARIQINAAHFFSEDDAMYELASEQLIIKNDDEEITSTTGCYYGVDKWTESNFSNPNNFYLADVHSTDYDKFENYIHLKPYTEQIEWMKDSGYSNELLVEYSEIGTHLFNINFKYNNFPFDKQTVSIKLISNTDMNDGSLIISDYSKKYLIDFQKRNNLAGWDIVDNRLVYGTYQDPVSFYPSSTVSLQIDLERKSGYYLYKVILPIVIILVVCWASLWIRPKELESKLTITIVCLLSLIAYNFVIDGEIPKLAYLTIIDWIILTSYFYAALPNILGIYFYNLYTNRNNKKLVRFESIAKKYGILSYLFLVVLIILLNVSVNYENASTMFSWLALR
ncbi:hypothetical protein OA950_02140 [Candidatus Pelagibacter sp.]|nr:hypothetical protein [Candidatus Pelagibacter sp.]